MYKINYFFFLVGLSVCVTNAANMTKNEKKVDIEGLYKALKQDVAKYLNKTRPKSAFCFPPCPQSNIQITQIKM